MVCAEASASGAKRRVSRRGFMERNYSRVR
jgi:hypothetical protein